MGILQVLQPGRRGQAVEATLPAFAEALKSGVTTIELDVSLTASNELIVWHDEKIDATKCIDTSPVTEADELFPYVGKNLANLTVEQIQTLDCGSLRLDGFPLAMTRPNTTLSTLAQLFDFVDCATDEPGSPDLLVLFFSLTLTSSYSKQSSSTLNPRSTATTTTRLVRPRTLLPLSRPSSSPVERASSTASRTSRSIGGRSSRVRRSCPN
jgi:hypothetical protein